ncbi:MAG: flagellar biosynthesis protein FlhB [Paracoccaceae bacterium]
MSAGDDTTRDHEPTQRKLEKARAEGDVIQSHELTSAATLGCLLLTFAAMGGWIVTRSGSVAAAGLGNADRLAEQVFQADRPVLSGYVFAALAPMAALFLLPAAGAIVALLLQRALVFATDRIVPRLSRIDPVAQAKHRFGPEGLAHFARSAAKLVLVSVALGAFLFGRIDLILGAQMLPPAQAVAELVWLACAFLGTILALEVALGSADYLLQWVLRLRRNRMSRQELVEELRDSEGDPHLRGIRRRRAEEVALSRAMADVPKADVVIVNPTHFAVALAWSRGSRQAPVCVAKGVDETARRIREIAFAAGVPVRSDPATARALYATVPVGQEIRPEHYRAVAVAIRFAEDMRRRARTRGG